MTITPYPEVYGVLGPLWPPVRDGRPGPGRCGCNPTYGASCRECDGTAAEERAAWADARRAERRAA